MGFKDFIHTKKRRYMAQILETFEQDIEPSLPRTDDMKQKIDNYKGLVRGRVNALAVDACDMHGIQNEAAVDLRASVATDTVRS